MLPVIAGIAGLPIRPLEFLSEKEKIFFSKLPFIKEQDYLLGRIAMKQALIKSGIIKSPNEVTVLNNPDGVPYVDGQPNLICSISHSYDGGLGAVALQRIGVDLEKIRDHDISLLDYIATKQEIHLLKNWFGPETDIVTLIWVIKESIMKAVGSGLSIPPRSVQINKKINSSVLEIKLDSVWYVWPDQHEDYYTAIAYESLLQEKPQINWS